MSTNKGVVYDAKTVCETLGLPCDCTEKALKAASGEIVVYYGGWTLGELAKTKHIGNDLFPVDSWTAPTGYYHVRFPMLGLNSLARIWDEW